MTRKSRATQRDALQQTALVDRMFKRMIEDSAMSRSQAKRFAQLSHNLSDTFRRVCPTLKPHLRGTIIALLLDVVLCSDEIKKDVQKLTLLKSPTDAQTLASFLKDMRLLRLERQQRYIAELLRNIPPLLRDIKKEKKTQSTRRGLLDQLTDIVVSYR